MSKKKYTLLLTACINPKNMIYTSVIDVSVRTAQYIEALNFYLKKTNFPIVFVENTRSDISDSFKEYQGNGRLEYLTFNGNNFDRNKGKGYGEAEILEYAICHSVFLQKTDFIVKVTGRLKVLNVMTLLQIHKYFLFCSDIQCVLNLKDSFADSRLFIATVDFLQNNFLEKKEMINDKKGVYLEHVLFNSIYYQNKYVFYPFFLRPIISGISGTSGKPYWEGNYYRVKLTHFQEMLNCSIQYNIEHNGNTSYIMHVILKLITKVVEFFDKVLRYFK